MVMGKAVIKNVAIKNKDRKVKKECRILRKKSLEKNDYNRSLKLEYY